MYKFHWFFIDVYRLFIDFHTCHPSGSSLPSLASLPTYLLDTLCPPSLNPFTPTSRIPSTVPPYLPSLPISLPTYLPPYLLTSRILSADTFSPPYLPPFLPTSWIPSTLPPYLPTYLPPHLPTYLPTYLLTSRILCTDPLIFIDIL